MKCNKWLPLISDLLDGCLDKEQEQEVRHHLQQCQQCHNYYAEVHDNIVMLQNLPKFSVPQGFANNLVAQLDQQPKAAANIIYLRWAMGVAAAVLLIFSILPMERRKSRRAAFKSATAPQSSQKITESLLPKNNSTKFTASDLCKDKKTEQHQKFMKMAALKERKQKKIPCELNTFNAVDSDDNKSLEGDLGESKADMPARPPAAVPKIYMRAKKCTNKKARKDLLGGVATKRQQFYQRQNVQSSFSCNAIVDMNSFEQKGEKTEENQRYQETQAFLTIQLHKRIKASIYSLNPQSDIQILQSILSSKGQKQQNLKAHLWKWRKKVRPSQAMHILGQLCHYFRFAPRSYAKTSKTKKYDHLQGDIILDITMVNVR